MKKTDIAGDPCYLIIKHIPNIKGNVYKFYPHNAEAAIAHWEMKQFLKKEKKK